MGEGWPTGELPVAHDIHGALSRRYRARVAYFVLGGTGEPKEDGGSPSVGGGLGEIRVLGS
jgi:hypothetical protein